MTAIESMPSGDGTLANNARNRFHGVRPAAASNHAGTDGGSACSGVARPRFCQETNSRAVQSSSSDNLRFGHRLGKEFLSLTARPNYTRTGRFGSDDSSNRHGDRKRSGFSGRRTGSFNRVFSLSHRFTSGRTSVESGSTVSIFRCTDV